MTRYTIIRRSPGPGSFDVQFIDATECETDEDAIAWAERKMRVSRITGTRALVREIATIEGRVEAETTRAKG